MPSASILEDSTAENIEAAFHRRLQTAGQGGEDMDGQGRADSMLSRASTGEFWGTPVGIGTDRLRLSPEHHILFPSSGKLKEQWQMRTVKGGVSYTWKCYIYITL